jgi:hypothetical protein
MPIEITRSGNLYEAEVSPPHGRARFWKSPGPTTVEQLAKQLRERGCHPTDIADALNEADPEWRFRLPH